MKKLSYILLLFPLWALGQTATENYVETITYRQGDTTAILSPTAAQASVNLTYADGLGRPIQQIAGKASATGKDIIQHIEYDDYGHVSKNYLPYAATGTGMALDADAQSNTFAFYDTPAYGGTVNPYSEVFYEKSPRNLPLKQGAPGASWAGDPGSDSDHAIKLVQATNTATEAKRFFATATLSTNTVTVTASGNYAAGQLYKTVTRDENWTSGKDNTKETFTNKERQVVLERAYNAGVAHDTYYIYDQYGNLSYVLPPLANGATTALNGLCYQYKYDNRGRLIEKRLPGKGLEYIVYDTQDRVVATGPALTPFGGTATGWLITKYDVFGRVAYTGWYASSNINSIARIAMQAQPFGAEARAASTTIDNIGVGYTNNTFPTTGLTLLTVNYYDNYSYPNAPAVPATVEAQAVATNVKGFSTGSWSRVLTSATEYNGNLSTVFYDGRKRPVRTRKNHYLGGFTQVDSKLDDFNGKVLYTIATHSRASATRADVTVRDEFTYTDQDRLLAHTHKIGSGAAQLLSQNEYDELGKLKNKKVGGVSGSAPFQKVDYSYNVRGWLTGINDVTSLVKAGDPDDLFAFKINYDEVVDDETGVVKEKYNGNIAETYWRTASDHVLRKYGFEYDALNRMRGAYYQKPENAEPLTNAYTETAEYDKNGNITSMLRAGGMDDPITFIFMDELVYTYSTNSNQLMKVIDGVNDPQGFTDDSNGVTDPTDDYAYDNNGNLTKDENKGITSITYNHLNLPTEIVFNNNSNTKINYFYTASGEKVKKTVYTYVLSTPANHSTDYLDGYQYFDAVLQFFPTAEGYVKYTPPTVPRGTGTYNYVYNYVDHLGNIRLSYGLDPATNVLKILEENHYYPFGLKHENYNSTLQQFQMDEVTNAVAIMPLALPTFIPPYAYKFNGQEWQDDLGLNMTAMDFRQYDNALGRFSGPDALSELSYSLSPYSFSFNNPVFWADPTGLNGYYVDKNGRVHYNPHVTPDNVPEGGTYLGTTYVDSHGYLWDEMGIQNTTLEEIVINVTRHSDTSSAPSFYMYGFSLWGENNYGDLGGWGKEHGTTVSSIKSSEIPIMGGEGRSELGTNIWENLFSTLKNMFDLWDKAENIENVSKSGEQPEPTVETKEAGPVPPPGPDDLVTAQRIDYIATPAFGNTASTISAPYPRDTLVKMKDFSQVKTLNTKDSLRAAIMANTRNKNK